MEGPIDSLLRANSAQPVNLSTGVFGAFGLQWNNDAINPRPNVVPGTPLYLYGSDWSAANDGAPCPGGRRFNPVHFSTPADEFTQGNLGRNHLRGFNAVQEDLALRRNFPIHDTVSLEFRAEAFNIFNHPCSATLARNPTGATC